MADDVNMESETNPGTHRACGSLWEPGISKGLGGVRSRDMGTRVLKESGVPGRGGSLQGYVSFQDFHCCHLPISTTLYLIFLLDSIQNSLKF